MKVRDREDLQRIESLNPHRTVDAPWLQARRVAAEGRRLVAGRYSEEVEEAVRYLRALGRCDGDEGRERVRRGWPELAEAVALAAEDGPRRWEAEARVLAGQNDEEVASRCGVTAGVARWFEALFFEVRSRLGAHDWVLIRAIRTETAPGLGYLWRHFGYFGGPFVLDLVIAVSRGGPLPGWVRDLRGADEEGFEERLILRCRLMIDVTLLPPDVDPFVLFRLHAQILEYEAAVRSGRPATSPADLVAAALAGAGFIRPCERPGAGKAAGA